MSEGQRVFNSWVIERQLRITSLCFVDWARMNGYYVPEVKS